MQGRWKGTPKKAETILVRIPPEQKKELEAEAKRYSQSVNTLCLIKLKKPIEPNELMAWLVGERKT